MNKAELDIILEDHKKYLDNDGGERANLWGADLRKADLREADLRGANLRGANLRGADLRKADLREADLQEANLWGANLREADLQEANLWGADLRGADLRGANLWGANLWGADLREANLREAKYNYAQILSTNLGKLNNKLTLELMRWDCSALPKGKGLFTEWKKSKGNECPFYNQNIERMFLFQENVKLWRYAKPQLTIDKLFMETAKELKIKI